MKSKCADAAGQVREDKNNKQQQFWLEGEVSGCVDVGLLWTDVIFYKPNRQKREIKNVRITMERNMLQVSGGLHS